MNAYEVVGMAIKIVWALSIYALLIWITIEMIPIIIGGFQILIENLSEERKILKNETDDNNNR